jgi:hypothetical protein
MTRALIDAPAGTAPRALGRLRDVLLFTAAILMGALSRLRVRARGDERRRSLPGDEIVPDARDQWTNAVTIRAQPAEIWPWILQMGCTRAGWYSYDGLDNGGRPSAERIVPGLQHVELGDVFPWTPTDREGFIVRAIEPGRALVLGGTPPPLRVSWAFVLEPLDEATTRLIARCRAVPRSMRVGLLLRLFHPVHFAMQRKQLLTLKRRVEAKVPYRTPRVGRLGTAAVWIAAVCCLPYLVFKAAWTVGIPVGIADRSVLDDSGWVAANALMAVVQLAAFGLVLALVRPWARRWPAWVLLFPAWVGTGLLFQVVVGAALIGLFSPPSQDSGMDTGEFEPWVFTVVYAGFAGQAAALAIAFACHVKARWGGLLADRTDAVLARRTARVRSWPENHLADIAQVVAVLAVATAVAFVYGAAGGSFRNSGAEPDVPWAMHASRAAGAVIAVVGLLGLAGRWGRQTRFWLPAALVWLGSGALVAFDGFWLMLNQLFAMFGTDASEPGWSLLDTLVVIKLLIGMLAAAVGALAVTAAARDDQNQRAEILHDELADFFTVTAARHGHTDP